MQDNEHWRKSGVNELWLMEKLCCFDHCIPKTPLYGVLYMLEASSVHIPSKMMLEVMLHSMFNEYSYQNLDGVFPEVFPIKWCRNFYRDNSFMERKKKWIQRKKWKEIKEALTDNMNIFNDKIIPGLPNKVVRNWYCSICFFIDSRDEHMPEIIFKIWMSW